MRGKSRSCPLVATRDKICPMTPEFGWEELLDFVRGRHVVSRGAQRTPRHRDRGRRALLHTHLGARLAAHLGLEQGDFSNGTDLSQVAFRFLQFI